MLRSASSATLFLSLITNPVENISGNIPVIALTATATPKVQQDILKNLEIQDADIYISSFNRPNLYYEIRPKPKDEFALNKELRDTKYPFSRLKGQDVNTLVFPNLSSANGAYKLLQSLDPDTEIIGPIQMGLNKPIHFTDFECSVRDVVNITAVAVIDAYVDKVKDRLI